MPSSYASSNTEVPSHRACVPCRSQKVRCVVSEINPDVCERCARSERQCVFKPLMKRKQRKRTDTRVADLEREVRIMQSLLQDKSKEQGTESAAKSDIGIGVANGSTLVQNLSNDLSGENSLRLPQSDSSSSAHHKPSVIVNHYQSTPTSRPLVAKATNTNDVVDRDLISMATARHLFETYRNELFPHYPMVRISSSVSADEMRQTKPILFLAIIAAGATKGNPDLSAALDRELLHVYAMKNLGYSHKSLELIQALLIGSVWYSPPDKFEQLKFYEHVHMAATMALDIGIGSRSVHHRSHNRPSGNVTDIHLSGKHPFEDVADPGLSAASSQTPSLNTDCIESRRTFISCYSVCTSVSILLRRPNMLRVSSYVRECTDILEHSQNALPSDKMLVAWVRLLMIAEEINNAFSYDDPGGIACITEFKTQLMLKAFSSKLDGWYNDVPKAVLNGSLTIMYFTTRLFLNEIALHVDHSPEDFKAPYQMGMMHQWGGDEIPTQIFAEGISECISCSHSLLNTFVAMDVEQLRSLPVLSYVRVAFAAFMLAKLSLSASQTNSQISRVLDRSSLKAEGALDKAILRAGTIVGSSKRRVPNMFLALLFKLRHWCLHPEQIVWLPQGGVLDSVMHDHAATQPSSESSRSLLTTQGYGLTEQGDVDDDLLHPYMKCPAAENESVGRLIGGSSAIRGAATTVTPIEATVFSNSIDPMEFDPKFFEVFGDVNALDEGETTGFADWGLRSTNLPSSI